MDGQMTFEFAQRPTIKGFPELRWTGKRPYRSTQYFPAQLRERYGEEKDGWINKIFWGDNLQVMSHMLKNEMEGYVCRTLRFKCQQSLTFRARMKWYSAFTISQKMPELSK